MDDIREQIGMSKVKADDMDAIGQSGAANLLRMNVDTMEKLLARNKKLEAVVEIYRIAAVQTSEQKL